EMERRGVRFRSLTEAIDTATPTGRLILQIFGAVAEFERAVNRERTRAGLAAARARGRTGGRPRALSSEKAKAAQAMLAEGLARAPDIAARFGVATSTLYRYLPRKA
ncbi:MAG TPA: recombinase family protein, partial [Asticcacaulis sp.]